MTPGSNLLNRALRIIAPQPFDYYAYTARTKNAAGLIVSAYADAVTLQGSVQAVPRGLYQTFGLDFQREYVTVFVSANLIDIARDVSGDQIAYAGKRYQALSKTPWFAQDGWISILCVAIPAPVETP